MPVVDELRRLGHDVLTVLEVGRAGQGIDDEAVLADGTADQRAVLTHNHTDFNNLHRQGIIHQGIISCTRGSLDPLGLARRIDAAIVGVPALTGRFIRVVRPNPSAKP